MNKGLGGTEKFLPLFPSFIIRLTNISSPPGSVEGSRVAECLPGMLEVLGSRSAPQTGKPGG